MKPNSRRTIGIFLCALVGGAGIALAAPSAATTSVGTKSASVWLEQSVTTGGSGAVIPPFGSVGDMFGNAVALSGNMAVIGAEGAQLGSGAKKWGAAFIFERSDGRWSKTARLLYNGEPDPGSPQRPVPNLPCPSGDCASNLGHAVAIADTNTVLVSAFGLSAGTNSDQGAVFVFHRQPDGSWIQTQELLASDGAEADEFGSSLAVDGDTAVVGAHFADPDGFSQAGAAYVFTRDASGTWSQGTKLVASDRATSDRFGQSVAIVGDTIMVGANWASVHGISMQGAVYVFTRQGGAWVETQKLSEGGVNAEFGNAVDFDGDTAVVGAEFADYCSILNCSPPHAGAAYVFTRSSDGTWQEVKKLSTEDDSLAFGHSVAVSGDTIIVGNSDVPVSGGDNVNQGAAYVYTRDGGNWSLVQRLLSSDGGAYDYYGSSVAVDGSTLLVGADGAMPPPDASMTGEAYFYTNADIALDITAPAAVEPGADYVSTVTVANNGSDISDVAIVAPLPQNAKFVSAETAQGSCNSGSSGVACNFSSLPGTATVSAAFTWTAANTAGNSIDNTVSVQRAMPALNATARTVIDNTPVAADGSVETDAGQAVDGELQAQDQDADPLTYGIVDEPQHGTLKLDAAKGTFTYRPAQDFTGSDSFTFKASDGYFDSNTATVKVTVNAASDGSDDPPPAGDANPPGKSSSDGGGGAAGPLAVVLLVLAALAAGFGRRNDEK